MAVLSASSLPRGRGVFAVSPSDPGIKLFGKTIPAPARTDNAAQPAEFQDEFRDEDDFSPGGVHDELRTSCGSGSGSEDEDCLVFSMKEKHQSEVPEYAEKPQESSKNLSPTMEGKSKAIRRLNNPIPCPRCQSLDTKFCYFNNYNVNQPRHFCKHCQRYWTAGGTLRNVPVGAGKRRCKNPSAQQRHDFGMRSVVYSKDDSGEAESLVSYSLPEQMTNVKPLVQSASQITICAGKDGSISSGSVSSHAQLLGTASSNGATSGTEWVEVTKNSSIDFPSHARDSYKEHSSSTSPDASTTERSELSLRNSSAKAPSIQNVSISDAERSTFCRDKSTSTPSENSSSTQILPVLALPWPFLCQMYPAQVPSCTLAPTIPHCPSAGNTLSCQWSPFPGTVWAFPSTVAPCATGATPTSLGKRPARDTVEGFSLSSPKTPKIHGTDSAASSSSLTALDTVEMMPKL